MARSHRHDAYGKPLPHLMDVGSATPEASGGKVYHPINIAQRQRMLKLLLEHCDAVLRRGITAEVTLSFDVIRGTIQEGISVGITQRYHPEDD